MQQQRWAEAAVRLDALAEVDPAAALQRRLAGNMAAAQQHRPDLYRALLHAEETGRYRVSRSRTGRLTVAYRRTDGRLLTYDLVVLEDDAGFFPPYQAAPLVRGETLRRHPELG